MRKTLLIMFIFLFAFSSLAIAAESEHISKSIIIDKTAPNVPTLEGVSDDWVNTDVVVTVKDIIDPVSGGVSAGVEKVEYTVNSTPSENAGDGSFTINLTEEGTYDITAKVIDKVGNVGETATGTVKIDKTPPAISLTGIEEGSVYYNSVAPEYSATDEKAGLQACTATIKKDDGNENPFTSNTVVNEQGNYVIKVTATDKAGNESIKTLNFSINAPTAATINANAISPASIKLEWEAIEGSTGYKVMDNGTEIDTIVENNYTHTGLNPNSEHTYTVVAYNPIGDSPISSEVKIYTLANKPSNLQITNRTSNSLTVTWEGDNPTGTEYSVAIAGGEEVTFTADLLSYTFSGLQLANTYTITVKARNFDSIETETMTIEASTNKAPVLTLTSPEADTAYSLVEGHNTIVVAGTVSDDDNDDVTITATINGNSKSVVVEKCKDGKPFEITFSANEFTEGDYTVSVVADDNR